MPEHRHAGLYAEGFLYTMADVDGAAYALRNDYHEMSVSGEACVPYALHNVALEIELLLRYGSPEEQQIAVTHARKRMYMKLTKTNGTADDCDALLQEL